MRELNKSIKKERRNKLEIYFDVIRSIEWESRNLEGTKPTRVQQQCNLSYDKFSRYMKDLEEKNMIVKTPKISITSKGRLFLSEYQVIKEFIDKMGFDKL